MTETFHFILRTRNPCAVVGVLVAVGIRAKEIDHLINPGDTLSERSSPSHAQHFHVSAQAVGKCCSSSLNPA